MIETTTATKAIKIKTKPLGDWGNKVTKILFNFPPKNQITQHLVSLFISL